MPLIKQAGKEEVPAARFKGILNYYRSMQLIRPTAIILPYGS